MEISRDEALRGWWVSGYYDDIMEPARKVKVGVGNQIFVSDILLRKLNECKEELHKMREK